MSWPPAIELRDEVFYATLAKRRAARWEATQRFPRRPEARVIRFSCSKHWSRIMRRFLSAVAALRPSPLRFGEISGNCTGNRGG